MSKAPVRIVPEKELDDALSDSFPASDPVAIGHSEHVGDPVRGRKRTKLRSGGQAEET